MKLEQQVTSLELSKRLKELGVKQESLFVWHDKHIWVALREQVEPKFHDKHLHAAFTVAELGEILPSGIHSFKCNTEHFLNKKHEKWWCDFTPGGKPSKGLYEGNCFANTEADARAKMLIYLLENKLISPNPVE